MAATTLKKRVSSKQSVQSESGIKLLFDCLPQKSFTQSKGPTNPPARKRKSFNPSRVPTPVKGFPEFSEAIGTFLLVFLGCMAIMTDARYGGLGVVGIGLVFGLIVAAVIHTTGHVSGAHINPAVTIALAVRGNFPWSRVPTYILAQSTGATIAAFLLRQLLGNVAHIGATLPAAGMTGPSLFVLEVIMTAGLVFVIVGTALDSRAPHGIVAIAVGGYVALASIAGGPLTGTSLNPARSLGPALADGDLTWLAIYFAATILGGILGALAYNPLTRAAPPGSDQEALLGKKDHIKALLKEKRT